MITYQKVYTDHVHSSTLMSQFTQLWKNNLMCDADINVGSSVIKAHRLVLVASCAILQSYDNAATGSVLEITLPSEIEPRSVHTFLEFLYQGHMILSQDNVQNIERIARLLHVEDVLKCCNDFTKTIKLKDCADESQKFDFHDLVDVNHVRVTSFIKSVSDSNSEELKETSKQRKPDGQKSSQKNEDMTSTKSVSSISFVSSPTILQRQRLRLGEHDSQTNSRPRTNSLSLTSHSGQTENLSQNSIVDLSGENMTNSRSQTSGNLSSHRRNSDQARSYRNETAGFSSKRRNSDQSTHSLNDSSTNESTFATRSHDNYYRSLSEEELNANNLRNAAVANFAAQYGFAMPVVPSTLWTDKAILQHFTSQQNQNPRCSSNTSMSSSSSSKASTSQPVTKLSSDFSDLPICLEQDDSGDNRLVLDVSEIDLSMIKTENVEQPLDLHVEGVLQAAEHIDNGNKLKETTAGQTSGTNKLEQHSPAQAPNYSASNQYNTAYQHSINSDISRQWSAHLQSAMVKKRPMSISTNVRKIIQDLNLNRRALASPAALGSLAVGNHKPIRMPGKNNYKVCSLCYRNKIRTKSGYYVYSYYKCSVCDVPLCIGRRKCFLEYHKEAESKGKN